MKTLSVYQTDDGQVFKTKEEAALHERVLAIQDDVLKFIDSKYYPYKKALNTKYIATRTIVGWEKFKEEKK